MWSSPATTRRQSEAFSRNDSKQIHEKLEHGHRLRPPWPGLQRLRVPRRRRSRQALDLDLHLSATGYAHSSGPLLLLRPRVLGTDARAVPDVMEGKPRAYSIELGHPGRWHDTYDIAIPPGYVVDETPDPIDIDLDFASYHSTVSAKETSFTTTANTPSARSRFHPPRPNPSAS